MADLEERVAALEAALSVPPLPPMTEEQVAEFKEKWAAAVERHDVKWLPHDPSLAPVLTPELARALLRECVTMVKPGETLVIRVHDRWTPAQVDEYQQYLNCAAGERFGVLVVIGEELGVAQAPVGAVLTSADPQPPPGTRVRDDCGQVWVHDGEGGYWLRTDSADGDPESWSKVAGNYGPVTVLEWGGSALMAGQPPRFATGGIVRESRDGDMAPLFLGQYCYLLAADGSPVTTPCLSRCLPSCDHGTACHERRYPPYWRDHDPDDCERRRAALDEHSRPSAGLEA